MDLLARGKKMVRVDVFILINVNFNSKLNLV